LNPVLSVTYVTFQRRNLSVPNVTKISILSNPNEDSRPTHPTSSIYTMDEVPLSRGDFRKAHSAWCSI
jgi:hypothetical protein